MMPSSEPSSAKAFSHIYVEEAALSHPKSAEILSRFPSSQIIPISHYKDLFNRGKQDFLQQKKAPALILALNRQEQLLYPGARFCQSFGHEYFYYTSNLLNCLYDCEYCYLQGMYPSGNLVFFVNTEDYFAQIEALLKQHPLYLCISYDTDLMALDGLANILQDWISFTAAHKDLTIEVRTKSAVDISGYQDLCDRVILAWTLSPKYVQAHYEHHTPSLSARIAAIQKALSTPAQVRLCFDPMLALPDYKQHYRELYQTVFSEIPPQAILDVGIGVFRISSDYLKNLRRKRHGFCSDYPYQTTNGFCDYGQKKSGEMIHFAESELSHYLLPEQIYSI